MRRNKRSFDGWIARAVVLAGLGLLLGCESGSSPESVVSVREAAAAAPSGPSVADLMKQRGLNEADVVGALKTYMPTGQARRVRALRLGRPRRPGARDRRAVHAPPQGHRASSRPSRGRATATATTATRSSLKRARRTGRTLTWADTHHPASRETKGDYDGQFLFIERQGQRARRGHRPRDFTTKQIVRSRPDPAATTAEPSSRRTPTT